MRRTVSWLAAVVVLTLAMPAQMGMGAVYNAPYYRTTDGCGAAACNPCCGDSPGMG